MDISNVNQHFPALSAMDNDHPSDLTFNVHRANSKFIKLQKGKGNKKSPSLHPSFKGIQHSHLYFSEKYKPIALINSD